jgi:hypothetical protein
MKSWFAWTLLVLAVAGIIDGFYAYRWYFARDGSSVRRAIVIPQSEHQAEDELAWIFAHHHGDLFPCEQALFCEGDRLYDQWNLGKEPNLEFFYFDLGVDKEICTPKSNDHASR